MKRHSILLILLAIILKTGFLSAQTYPLQITIIPKATYFPPYIGEYIDDPYRFFDVTVNNLNTSSFQFYLVLRLEMVNPPDFTGTTPIENPPSQGLTINAMQSGLMLTPPMWDQLLGHLSEPDIVTTGLSIDDYRDGLGLLPEGQYKACITAYDFNATPGNPIPLSDPDNTCAFFTICYSATAPMLINPISCANPENQIISPSNLINFTWTPPLYNCAIPSFVYTLKIVELMDGQDPETALDFNATSLEVDQIMTTVYSLDTNVFPLTLFLGRTYAVRVTAVNNNLNRPVFLTNNGGSPACTFIYGESVVPPADPPGTPEEPWVDPTVEHDASASTITECFAGASLSTQAYVGDLNGRRISIGHFTVVVAVATQGAAGSFTGHGHLNWMPFGDTVRVKVEFADIKVNTQLQVFDGEIYATANTDLDNYVPKEIQQAKEWADGVFNYAQKLGIGASTNPYHARMQGYYDMIKDNTPTIEQLINSAPSYLPITIRSMVTSSPIDIGIIGMCLTPNSAKMNTMAVFDVPESMPGTNSRWLAFVGQGMCFTPDNLLFLGEGALFLAADFNLELPADFELNFKRATILGDTSDGTFVKWDNSGFRQARIELDVLFPNDLRAEDGTGTIIPNQKVKARFSTHFREWDNWIATATMDPFQIAGIPSFSFKAQDIVYDHSKTANAAQMFFPPTYSPNGNTWSGFFIREFSIKLPADFKTFNTGDARTSISVQNMLIDDEGVTSDIYALNLINLNTGNLGGWSFSLDTIKLKIWKSSFNQAFIGGNIRLPISQTPLKYRGELRTAGNEMDYDFCIRPSEDIKMNMWLATLTLDESSGFSLQKDAGGMAIECLLQGDISIASVGTTGIQIGIPQINFENFGIANRIPGTSTPDFYIGLGTWSVASPQKTLGPFNVNYENPTIVKEGNTLIALKFTVGFGILSNFNCTTSLDILGKVVLAGLTPPTTEFQEVRLQEITVTGEFNPVYISGKLNFYYDHATYGTGMKGRVVATFNPLLTIDATAQFGTIKGSNSFDYWYVDARAAFSPGIDVFPLNIGGFGGGVWYNMDAQNVASSPSAQFADNTRTNIESLTPDQSLSGINYIPKKNSWGLKAGITLTLSTAMGGGKVMNGSAWVICSFANDHFTNLRITGDVFALTDYPANKNPLAKASMQMGYDFVENIFDFNLIISARMLSATATIPIAFWADADDGLWFLKLGDPHGSRITVTVFDEDAGFIKGHLGAEAYFAFGNALDNTSLPPIPEQIQTFLAPVDLSKYRTNPSSIGGPRKGLLFGAKVDGSLDINLILYAHLEAIAGFDVTMYYDENNNCNGKPAGYNGWYGNGQIYGYFDGDIGIKIDVWFFKGSVSLARLTAGALLIGGMPDPFWAYGKVKVKGSILGGLIKVSTSLEMEVGEPCYPGGDNPLANIRILEEMTPGYETIDDAKQYEPESVFITPSIISNIELTTPTSVRLINLEIPPNARNSSTTFRTFVFLLENVYLLQGNANTVSSTGTGIQQPFNVNQNNPTLVSLPRDEYFLPNTCYKLRAVATALQFYPNQGTFGWPEIDGVKSKHIEELITYFKTGALPDYITQEEKLLSLPLNRQRFFFKNNDYYLSLKASRPDLFINPEGRRIEAWINQTYSFDGVLMLNPTKIPFAAGKQIKFFPNKSTLENEMVYTISLIRINEAKEQEFIQQLAIEKRRQVVHDLLSNQTITSLIGPAGLQAQVLAGASLTGQQGLNGLILVGQQTPGLITPTLSTQTGSNGTHSSSGSYNGLSKGAGNSQINTPQMQSIQQEVDGLWNDALQEHNEKYKKDTLDYRQMALSGKYDMGFIDTLFTVTFRTSKHNSLDDKMYAYRKLEHFNNSDSRSEMAAEPFEYIDIYGYQTVYGQAYGYAGAILPLLQFRETIDPIYKADDKYWKEHFFDIVHRIDDDCEKTSFKPRPNIPMVQNVKGLSLTFRNYVECRELTIFPLSDRQPSYYFPSRGIQIRHEGNLSGPYFLNKNDVAGPLSNNEIRGPGSASFADAKIKYPHGLVRQNLIWDMQVIEGFVANFKNYASQYEATNGAGRNALANKWINEERTIAGQSILTSISLPIYQFVNWHSKSYVIYDHFKNYTPAFVDRGYPFRDINIFTLDQNDPTTYKTTRTASIRNYY